MMAHYFFHSFPVPVSRVILQACINSDNNILAELLNVISPYLIFWKLLHIYFLLTKFQWLSAVEESSIDSSSSHSGLFAHWLSFQAYPPCSPYLPTLSAPAGVRVTVFELWFQDVLTYYACEALLRKISLSWLVDFWRLWQFWWQK